MRVAMPGYRRVHAFGAELVVDGTALSRASEALEDLPTFPSSEVDAMVEKAMDSTRPLVRSLLVANFSSAGLTSRSGKLVASLKEATVRFARKGMKMGIQIYMKAGMTPYVTNPNGKPRKPANFYTASASKEYGAVHSMGGGEKIKRKFKALVLEHGMDYAVKMFEKRKKYYSGHKGNSPASVAYRSIEPTKADVRMPWKFFRLSEVQRYMVINQFFKGFAAAIRARYPKLAA